MDADTFVRTVIAPALTAIGLDSPGARELLLRTAIQESGLRNTPQMDGPALGYFQMEPATHKDCWDNYLTYHPDLGRKILSLVPPSERTPKAMLMLAYPQYAAALCRIRYLRVPAPLPLAGDVDAQAAYWKHYYNTPLGRGTVAEFIANSQRVMGA